MCVSVVGRLVCVCGGGGETSVYVGGRGRDECVCVGGRLVCVCVCV